MKRFFVITGTWVFCLSLLLLPLPGASAAESEKDKSEPIRAEASENRNGSGASESSAGAPAQKQAAEGEKAEGVEELSGSAKGVEAPEPDRRWIIKTRKSSKPPAPAEAPEVKWATEAQKEQCEEIKDRLRRIFQNVRYYSVRGDGCNTARYSETFLATIEEADRRCPEGLMEQIGYSEIVVDNVRTLLELGNKRCLGPALIVSPERVDEQSPAKKGVRPNENSLLHRRIDDVGVSGRRFHPGRIGKD